MQKFPSSAEIITPKRGFSNVRIFRYTHTKPDFIKLVLSRFPKDPNPCYSQQHVVKNNPASPRIKVSVAQVCQMIQTSKTQLSLLMNDDPIRAVYKVNCMKSLISVRMQSNSSKKKTVSKNIKLIVAVFYLLDYLYRLLIPSSKLKQLINPQQRRTFLMRKIP